MENFLFRLHYLNSFFFAFFLFTADYIFAEQGIRFYEKTEIIQRINWEKENDVLKYELVIEKNDGGGFTKVLDNTTEEDGVEISLPPGEYRYRVIVYDMLGRQSPAPEWSRLNVLPALQPEIISINPQFIDIADSNTTINLNGNNFSPNAEVYFIPAEGGEKSRQDILSQSSPLNKSDYSAMDTGGAQLKLAGLQLAKGFYDIVIKNPGGLFTVWRNYKIIDGAEYILKEKPAAHLKISTGAAYTMLIPVSGSFNDSTKGNISPAGASARLGINTPPKSYGIFGVELAAYWHSLTSSQDAFIVSGNLTDAQINILYQIKILNQRIGVNARIGGGLAYFFDLQFSDVYSDEFQINESLMPIGAASLSFSWFFYKNFFIDIGVEYLHIFSSDGSMPTYIRPLICFGLSL
jgi:hypothetical protein